VVRIVAGPILTKTAFHARKSIVGCKRVELKVQRVSCSPLYRNLLLRNPKSGCEPSRDSKLPALRKLRNKTLVLSLDESAVGLKTDVPGLGARSLPAKRDRETRVVCWSDGD
jgi:hypothetical protein